MKEREKERKKNWKNGIKKYRSKIYKARAHIIVLFLIIMQTK